MSDKLHSTKNVTLGKSLNSGSDYRKEVLAFEVVDFKVHGHPTLHLSKMKMAGPHGIITVAENF